VFRSAGQSTTHRLAQEPSRRQRSSRVTSCFVITQNRIAEALRREHGGTAVEYGLITALIAAVIAGVVAALGVRVDQMFTSLLNAF
jgi:Flp pilus assembly pilin Flp